jgi:hypothetical protein
MATPTNEAWPTLDGDGGRETATTLQLWSQVIGKTRLSLCPMTNQWWQVALYVSARGLTTSPMPVGERVLEVELDMIDHRLDARTSDGAVESMPLQDGTLAGFYAQYAGALSRLGIPLHIWPVAVELPEPIHLDTDDQPRRYDPDWANRLFRALTQADRLFKKFRAKFVGKASPVHLFWGGFDLAVTRFSGRPAPPHPGGIPNVADYVMREAYSQEVSSAGFWPGDPRMPEPAFYSYAYPAPAGFEAAPVRPAGARFDKALGEFVLPYETARRADDPSAAVMAFLESTYGAAADLGRWDRAALERRGTEPTPSGQP